MQQTTRKLSIQKNIALVAHDHCKDNLLDWVIKNKQILSCHTLYATGTTGHLLTQQTGLSITRMISGPMGGDQQLGALISECKIDVLVFFWDPLNAVPHDPDVKALLRIASVWNIPTAINRASADFIFASDLISHESDIIVPDYQSYIQNRTTT
jgi:methylglyoxal synthase